MTTKRGSRGLWVFALLVIAIGTGLALSKEGWEDFWRGQVSPGPLSPAHSFLEGECESCHVTLESIPDSRCIGCHADGHALLQRQSTAFHGSIQSCTACHVEHDGSASLRAPMDHQALAQIGAAQSTRNALSNPEAKWFSERLQLLEKSLNDTLRTGNSLLAANELLLVCVICHESKDRHRGFFGRDCGECHATTEWVLAQFRHPGPTNQDCVQCHEAPPSHYMEHFRMISQSVAEQPHAAVEQCYLCHQTTSWNDIRGAGFYDHH